eukprot:TRINITY_DN1751_c0_g1_i1.p1 TRINITY_DN1751_c0_g1~~TRINITY_DN1751_c0_g1_i1.p1  ORF type:complete len:646 (-),score=85.91 TRINITY_DN1751_c0_g1_i1:115-2052(-)
MASLVLLCSLFVVVTGLVDNRFSQSTTAQEDPQAQTAVDDDEVLPDVATLVSSEAFSATKAKLAELHAEIVRQQQHDSALIRNQKSQNERELAEQRRVNDAIRQNCDDISYRNDELKASNARLFERSRHLSKENDQIKSDLLALRANLTLAQEVLFDGLAFFESEAPELDVLREMDEQDAVANRIRQKQDWLQDGDDASANFSFLQLSSHGQRTELFPKKAGNSQSTILQQLYDSLDEIAKETNSSMTLIRESFHDQFEHILATRTALLNEQAQLNDSNAEALGVHKQLLTAVNHLTSVHESLFNRRRAIQGFAANLGSTLADDIERDTTSKHEAKRLEKTKNVVRSADRLSAHAKNGTNATRKLHDRFRANHSVLANHTNAPSRGSALASMRHGLSQEGDDVLDLNGEAKELHRAYGVVGVESVAAAKRQGMGEHDRSKKDNGTLVPNRTGGLVEGASADNRALVSSDATADSSSFPSANASLFSNGSSMGKATDRSLPRYLNEVNISTNRSIYSSAGGKNVSFAQLHSVSGQVEQAANTSRRHRQRSGHARRSRVDSHATAKKVGGSSRSNHGTHKLSTKGDSAIERTTRATSGKRGHLNKSIAAEVPASSRSTESAKRTVSKEDDETIGMKIVKSVFTKWLR